MKLLYATTNRAKFQVVRESFSRILPEVHLLSLQDVGDKGFTAPEPGQSVAENAAAKARAYFHWYHIPCIAVDCGLWFEELPAELNPGVYVRRVHGRYLNDEEMVQYYGGLVRTYGPLTGRWINAMCLILPDGSETLIMNDDTATDPFQLTLDMRPILEPGFPMDSFSVDVKSGMHYYDIDWEAHTVKNVDDAFALGVRKALEEINLITQAQWSTENEEFL